MARKISYQGSLLLSGRHSPLPMNCRRFFIYYLTVHTVHIEVGDSVFHILMLLRFLFNVALCLSPKPTSWKLS